MKYYYVVYFDESCEMHDFYFKSQRDIITSPGGTTDLTPDQCEKLGFKIKGEHEFYTVRPMVDPGVMLEF